MQCTLIEKLNRTGKSYYTPRYLSQFGGFTTSLFDVKLLDCVGIRSNDIYREHEVELTTDPALVKGRPTFWVREWLTTKGKAYVTPRYKRGVNQCKLFDATRQHAYHGYITDRTRMVSVWMVIK